ncbi:MAG TPA: lactate utilization protein LutB domain-containing protein, partial [Acidimicrobiia bacterium]
SLVAGPPSVRTKRARPHARRLGFGTWAVTWASPAGYRASMGAARLGRRILGRDGWAHRAPGLRGWTAGRDLPLPAARSFRDRWDSRREGDDRW